MVYFNDSVLSLDFTFRERCDIIIVIINRINTMTTSIASTYVGHSPRVDAGILLQGLYRLLERSGCLVLLRWRCSAGSECRGYLCSEGVTWTKSVKTLEQSMSSKSFACARVANINGDFTFLSYLMQTQSCYAWCLSVLVAGRDTRSAN